MIEPEPVEEPILEEEPEQVKIEPEPEPVIEDKEPEPEVVTFSEEEVAEKVKEAQQQGYENGIKAAQDSIEQ